MTEFNLSEKIYEEWRKAFSHNGMIKIEDVKEFIKELKKHSHMCEGVEVIDVSWIDKLAGGKLI